MMMLLFIGGELSRTLGVLQLLKSPPLMEFAPGMTGKSSRRSTLLVPNFVSEFFEEGGRLAFNILRLDATVILFFSPLLSSSMSSSACITDLSGLAFRFDGLDPISFPGVETRLSIGLVALFSSPIKGSLLFFRVDVASLVF